MMTCKKIFILLFVTLLCVNSSQAFQSGKIEKNSVFFDYSKLDAYEIGKEADSFFEKYQKAEEQSEKENWLNLSAGKYYLLTKIDNTAIRPYVQLGRIYDEKNKTGLAKENFYKATNLNALDPYANFYFGEFYYKRNDYKRALKYYNTAYNNGLNNRYDLNIRLAVIYEKFADLVNAKKFYEISNSIKPDSALQEKIRLLNESGYDKSEYYNIIRE